MIDHLVGRPSPSWKRAQVFLVIFFWLWRILRSNSGPPKILWLRRANRLLKQFTPWQIILSTLTSVYAVRNLDHILGLGSPEPLARLYSPSYYRATWISTGLDAGFATAMSIRPKWLRDICSILFSAYYIIYANQGDEKLRRFRAVPTVEMLRTTWGKTTNPYIRLATPLPRVSIRRRILLPRPGSSSYARPITAYLFFSPPERQLSRATELILDFPGGGFVAMTPEHHEERLRMWAVATGRPVLSIDYGKAPEYPYPFAIDEAHDTYKILVETAGKLIGMSGKELKIVISGDSAGAAIAINVVIKILEQNNSPSPDEFQLPLPLSLVLNYAALDFNFTSWMSADNLRVLRSEQSSGNLPGLRELAAQKNHLQHVSPLSMVKERRSTTPRKRVKRKTSWKDTLRGLASSSEKEPDDNPPSPGPRRSISMLKSPITRRSIFLTRRESIIMYADDSGALADAESDEDQDFAQMKEEDRPIQARVKYMYSNTGENTAAWADPTSEQQQRKLSAAVMEANNKALNGNLPREQGKSKEPIGTRLTMTSRTGYFQDRIVSPSMMRAMAILYIGPHRNPDFATDYHISPILTPTHLLAQFPPLLMQCGEKDPFVDDTVIFAGRVREAKRARKVELDMAISGKSARFGESLRMSGINTPSNDASLFALKQERDKLARESEEDWVQMVLFSDWSHGYLQMSTLMTEARAVIEDLGEWIHDAFGRYGEPGTHEIEHKRDTTIREHHVANPEISSQRVGIKTQQPSSPFTSEAETDDSGITFVPKRQHNHPQASPPGVGRSPVRCSSPLATLADEASAPVGGEGRAELRVEVADIGHHELLTSEVPEAPKAAGPRQTGQTITETELMRRRRLLDSHIFE